MKGSLYFRRWLVLALAFTMLVFLVGGRPPRLTVAAGGIGGGGRCNCGGSGGGSVVDPPPGAPFADPALLQSASNTQGVVKSAQVSGTGTQANRRTYGGSFPGFLDFRHPHRQGLVAERYWSGLIGAIAARDPTPLLSGYETHTMILTDVSLGGSEPAPCASTMDCGHGNEGNVVVVNGQVNPVLTAKPGQVQRWRIVDASNARFFKLQLAGHAMQLIGSDGGPLDKPYPLTSIVLSPGERIDVLVKASATTGTYKLLSLPNPHVGNVGGQVTLMTLSVEGSAQSEVIPSIINPGTTTALPAGGCLFPVAC